MKPITLVPVVLLLSIAPLRAHGAMPGGYADPGKGAFMEGGPLAGGGSAKLSDAGGEPQSLADEGADKGLMGDRPEPPQGDGALRRAGGGQVPGLYKASLRMLLALVFVMALILASYWAFKRFAVGRGGLISRGRFLRVLATGYLGPKKSIAVVDILGQVLVLGITTTEINLITRIEDPDVVRKLRDGVGGGSGAGSFQRYLERLWPGGRDADRSASLGGSGMYEDANREGMDR